MGTIYRSARILFVLFVATLLTSLTSAPTLAADPFPADLPGTNIGAGLGLGYETSGVVWHSRLERIFTVDDGGRFSSMEADGSDVQHWNLAGDDEAITVADPNTNLIYVGRERGNTIVEFDFVAGSHTRVFQLSQWMTSLDNSGLEALTFVPDPDNPEGGLFYAGQQSDGVIYAFQLPLISDPNSIQVSFQFSFPAAPDRADLSGLHYDVENDILYAIWDSSNLLRAMQTDGTFLAEWELAGNNQEGVSFQNSNLLIAQDSGNGDLIRYTSFPIGLPDPSADFDLDGDVDGADFLSWQRGFGTMGGASKGQGDANDDGNVDDADQAIWETQYGSPPPLSNMNAIPEPTTSMLIVLSALGLLGLRCNTKEWTVPR